MIDKNSQRRKPNGKYEYFRVCVKCGDEKWMSFRPKKNAICSECAEKEMIKRCMKKEDEKVKYWYFCPSCSSVRVLSDKRKSNYCITCSRKHSKTVKPYYFFDFDTLKVRTLTVNPKPLPKVKKKKIAKPKKPRKSRTRSVSPEAIKKQIEVNRLHKEEVKKQEKKVVQRKSDAEMIAEFLKHKEPSVKASDDDFPTVFDDKMAMSAMTNWMY